MQSQAKSVSEYIQEAPPERRPHLEGLRELCREVLIGYEEKMEYGMPGYARDGKLEIGFANQKKAISLYILKEAVMKSNQELLAGLDVGKGCIRFSNPKKMDLGVVRKLLADTAQSAEAAC